MSYDHNAFQTARDNAPALAAAAAQTIVRIERWDLKKGYRFTAVMQDGSTVVVRQQATRAYAAAHLHSAMVATGKSGLSACFSFGQKPADPDRLLRTFAVVTVGGVA